MFTKATDIKQKAEASEEMATKICSQIKTLDLGKRNLTVAVRTLKRLQMMGTSMFFPQLMLFNKLTAHQDSKLCWQKESMEKLQRNWKL